MKIIGMMVCGPGEADKYLERPLKEFKRLCDDVLIATNNADEKTIKLIEEYGYDHYSDDREWGIHQPDIKTDLLLRIADRNPDWVIALDADECFAPEFTRDEAERLAGLGEIAYQFLVVNLYNDENHFAHGSGIQRFWNVRFFRYLKDQDNRYIKKNVHCGLAPPLYYQYAWHAPYYLLHYGLMKAEDRARRVERYDTYDPNARFKGRQYYDDLAREMPMFEFQPKQLLAKIAESQEGKPRDPKPRFLQELYESEKVE